MGMAENQCLRKWGSSRISLGPFPSFFYLAFSKKRMGGCLCFVDSFPSLPSSLLSHHSACLSCVLSSRNAETFLQLSGFFPRKNISNRPFWLGLISGLVALIVLNQHPPAQLGKCPIIPPFHLLFLLQLFYSFSGVKKKASPKTKILCCPWLVGWGSLRFYFAQWFAALSISRNFWNCPVGYLGTLTSLQTSPVNSNNKDKENKHLFTNTINKIYLHKWICLCLTIFL